MVPESTMSALDYLDSACLKWTYGTVHRREAAVTVGRLIHLYVYTSLVEAKALPFVQMIKVSRRSLIKIAAIKLDVSGKAICEMISNAMVADLMSLDGNLGNISTQHLKLFVKFIDRKIAPKTRCYGGPEIEEWYLRDGCDEAVNIFRKAVNEGVSYRKTKEDLAALKTERKSRGRCGRQPNVAKQDEQNLRINIPAAIKVCAPKEAAQMLYQELLSNHDPVATAHHLASMIQGKQFESDLRELERNKRFGKTA